MRWYHWILLAGIIFVYLVLRLGWLDTIEFGYDQPRLARTVIDFLNNPTFFGSFKYVIGNAWGGTSWGPAQIFFWAPFLLISKNPLTLSMLVAVFNLLSVLLVIFIGFKFISPGAGLIAGLFLATQPWWAIFSRMVYEPTPLPFFISLAILITFFVIKNKHTKWILILAPIWIFLLQLYYHSVSFIGASLVILLTQFKKLSVKYLFISFILSAILFLPYLNKKYSVPMLSSENQQVLIKGKDDAASRLKVLTPHFISIISGGDFSWQLGYGYDDFLLQNPHLKTLFYILTILTITMILINILLLSKEEYRIYRLALIFWIFAPIPFLVTVPLPDIIPIPRYFLICLPALSLLWGVTFDMLYKKISNASYFILIVPILWMMLVINYYGFIENYSYKKGHLSVFSDTPYLFTEKALRFIISDSQNRGDSTFIISNDEASPKSFSLDWATGYTWEYVFNGKTTLPTKEKAGYYLIDYSLDKPDSKYEKILRTGPLSVYRYSDL